jgi:sialate O-acetylesterase
MKTGRRLRLSRSLLLGIALLALPLGTRAEVKVPSFFSDGAVLQRDTAAPVWGTASPGEQVTLNLNDQTATATADDKGNWTAVFRPLPAGGPFVLSIKGGSNEIHLKDVLVGDVWLCSGQSNMTLHMVEILDVAKDDLAASSDPLLHCFTVPQASSDDPVQSVTGSWSAASPGTVKGWSAVAYYFAKELRDGVKVPIGIIHCSYPGSCCEAWVRKEALDALGMGPEDEALSRAWKTADDTTGRFLSDLNNWETKMGRQDPGNKCYAKGWADPKTDVNTWTTIPTPGDWSPLGLANGGVVWIRKSVMIPAEHAGKNFNLQLGNLQNYKQEFGNVLGTVYFNNQEVGSLGRVLKHTYSKPDNQVFYVPGSLVVAGANVVAVRVFTQEQKGPLWGGGANLLGPQIKQPVAPEWLASVEAELPPAPPNAASTRPVPPEIPPLMQLPSILFNGMLSPVVGYGIKGAVWYQGEGNTDRAPAYGKLLSALIADWRGIWKQGDFPFYIVQLANCFPPVANPGKSTWAVLREEQLKTWQAVPGTGMAVTIDVGDAANIHYHNKKAVGHRLALAALAGTYGQQIGFSGPIYDSMTVEGHQIRLKFTHMGGGLVAKNGRLKRFAIAGQDHNFVWGDAVIDGDTVLVSSAKVAQPLAVRYAWADNPEGCNLYNKDDLPASPFRTDNWPLR